MKKLCVFLSMLIIIGMFTGCSTPQSKDGSSLDQVSDQSQPSSEALDEEEPEKELLIKQIISSEALKNNIVDERTERDVFILLPPSYYTSDKTYPVVYFFHGYNEVANNLMNFYKQPIINAFTNGAKEFIWVGVDGRSNSGGSFYENSPIAGNWEDYVIDEVIPFVDDNYRTIKDAKSRGFSGFSMGGYASYNLALKHPDVATAFLAIAPGVLADNDLRSALISWSGDSRFKTAYARAFSPNKDIPNTFGNIPNVDLDNPENTKIMEEWQNGFGNVDKKIDDYLALKTPLTAMKIIYGEKDTYSWIPRGCEFFSERLKERNIEHSLESYPIAHNIPSDIVETYLVPFFNENLTY